MFGRKLLKKKNNPSAPQVRASVKSYSIIVAPIVTEKASSDGTVGVLEVDRRATKDEIKEAVERVFSVKVAGIRTANMPGKPKRTSRSVGRSRQIKKAYITLKEGYRFQFVEGL